MFKSAKGQRDMLRIDTMPRIDNRSAFKANASKKLDRKFLPLWHKRCISVNPLRAVEQPSTTSNTGPLYWISPRGCLAPDHDAVNTCLAPVAGGPLHHIYDQKQKLLGKEPSKQDWPFFE